MVTHIKKRDGRVEAFDENKIIKAIKSAQKRTDEKNDGVASDIAMAISKIDCAIMTVEQVQDEVERLLVLWNLPKTAKEYIIYRHDRSKFRELNTSFHKLLREKLEATNVENQNANVDERSFGGRIGALTSEVMKQIALDEYVSETARNNHLNNEIYIHDLDHYAVGDHNCMTLPFDDLLANGFNTRQTDVRPAQSINTAFQLLAVLFQLQSLQQFGGVSAGHLDWTMVPYVRKSFFKHFIDGLDYVEDINTDYVIDGLNNSLPIDDPKYKKHQKAYGYALDMTDRELKQAVEGMYHNLK